MKKLLTVMMVLVMGMMLGACSSNGAAAKEINAEEKESTEVIETVATDTENSNVIEKNLTEVVNLENNVEQVLLDNEICKVTFSKIDEYKLDEVLNKLRETSEDEEQETESEAKDEFYIGINIEAGEEIYLIGEIVDVSLDNQECTYMVNNHSLSSDNPGIFQFINESGSVNVPTPLTCNGLTIEEAQEANFTLLIFQLEDTETTEIFRGSYTVQLR